jgi:ribosomal protein S18 acetylase RimI-like enzyme
MSQKIRPAESRDQPDVESVVQSAYEHYVPRLGRKPAPMLDDYGSLIRNGRVHVLDVDGTVEGVVVLVPEEVSLLLDNIAVRPGAQGRGYGRMLLEFTERFACNSGYTMVRLYTNEAMTENIALYSRIGFMETHRAEELGLRRVYMIKTLA